MTDKQLQGLATEAGAKYASFNANNKMITITFQADDLSIEVHAVVPQMFVDIAREGAIKAAIYQAKESLIALELGKPDGKARYL